jgi:hypothetical protein
MLPFIWGLVRVYSPYIVFPFAVVIGTIGYNIEKRLSDRQTPITQKDSVEKERDERLLKQLETSDATNVESLKKKSFIAKTIFEKNLSPSLKNTDNN